MSGTRRSSRNLFVARTKKWKRKHEYKNETGNCGRRLGFWRLRLVQTIAYDNPGGIPGGTYGSTTAGMQDLPLCSLGLNFTVNAPIVVHGPWRLLITASQQNLAGADGSSGVTVGIYNDTRNCLWGRRFCSRRQVSVHRIMGDAFKAISSTRINRGNDVHCSGIQR